MHIGRPRKHRVKMSADEYDAFSRWRRALCVFENNTGIVKDAQRSYQKRVRQDSKREIDYYEES